MATPRKCDRGVKNEGFHEGDPQMLQISTPHETSIGVLHLRQKGRNLDRGASRLTPHETSIGVLPDRRFKGARQLLKHPYPGFARVCPNGARYPPRDPPRGPEVMPRSPKETPDGCLGAPKMPNGMPKGAQDTVTRPHNGWKSWFFAHYTTRFPEVCFFRKKNRRRPAHTARKACFFKYHHHTLHTITRFSEVCFSRKKDRRRPAHTARKTDFCTQIKCF